jgi:hypothetical protein
MQQPTAPQLPLCPVSNRGRVAAQYVVEGQTATSRCWDAPRLAGRFLIGLPPLVRSDASAGGVRTMRKTFSVQQALEISPHIHVHRQQPLQGQVQLCPESRPEAGGANARPAESKTIAPQ